MRPRPGSGDLVVFRSGRARFGGAAYPCAIGRGGFVGQKREGDGAAPFGRFALEQVYYRPDRLEPPATMLPVSPIRPWHGWSDDPEDAAYNQLVRRPWSFSHERLWRADPLYDLIAVLDINRRPARPGGGSALFLHVWRGPRRPTAGCIAFRRADLLDILRGWRPGARVAIGDQRRA